MKTKFYIAIFFFAILIIVAICDDKKETKNEEKPTEEKLNSKWTKAQTASNKKRKPTNENIHVAKPVAEELKIITTSQTCMEIAMGVTAKNKEKFEELTTRAMELNQDFGEEEARNFVLSFYLVNCIQFIDDVEIGLIRSQKKAKIEIDYDEYKSTIKYDEVNEILVKNDSDKIFDYNAKVDFFNKQYKEAYQKLQDQRGGDAFKRKGDVGIFGNKFKDMSKKRKNLIGFGLLIIIIIVLGYMASKLIKPKNKEKKKKKEKEKKKN